MTIDTSQINANIASFDDRRTLFIASSTQQAIHFSVEHLIALANEAIASRGHFYIALSGGKTPKAIFASLASPENASRIDWQHVSLFWSDERAVGPDDSESNFRSAMDAGLGSLPLQPSEIYRLKGESSDLDAAALEYETIIREKLKGAPFDLVMLGMGDDGHTASLFPKTHGLHAEERLVIANYIPQKACWRLTLTMECINKSLHCVFYVLGKEKASMLKQVLAGPYSPDELPAQKVGTRTHKALWIVDAAAASALVKEVL